MPTIQICEICHKQKCFHTRIAIYQEDQPITKDMTIGICEDCRKTTKVIDLYSLIIDRMLKVYWDKFQWESYLNTKNTLSIFSQAIIDTSEDQIKKNEKRLLIDDGENPKSYAKSNMDDNLKNMEKFLKKTKGD